MVKHRMEHLSRDDIWDFLISPDTLSGSKRDHGASCPSCRREVNLRRDFVDALNAARLPVPGEALVNATLSRVLGAPPREVRDGTADSWAALTRGLHRIAAAFVSPSPGMAGIARGAITGPSISLHETDDLRIIVSVETVENSTSLRIQGQIVPREADTLPPGLRAWIVSEGHNSGSDVDDSGIFVFETVPNRPGRIFLVTGKDLIDVGPILPPAAGPL